VQEEMLFSPPDFAPLPLPFVQHLLAEKHLSPAILKREIVSLRLSAALLLSPFVQRQVRLEHKEGVPEEGGRPEEMQQGSVTTGLLQRLLAANSPSKRSIPLQTISSWHKRGLLRYRQWGNPDFDNAAALLIMRLLLSKTRGWLPSEMAADEPCWWCWRQDAPDAPVVACPVPLPDDLPPSSLLWTPWSGAAWNRSWVGIGEYGALRWASLPGEERPGKEFSLEMLARWDIRCASLYEPFPPMFGFLANEANNTLLAHLATLALYRLARHRVVHENEYSPRS
jgi:hypothetical protein